MRRVLGVVALAAALLVQGAAPSQARSRGWHGPRGHGFHYGGSRVVIGVGPAFWWGSGWVGARPAWAYGPQPYGYVRYGYAPPTVIVEPPPVYVEREPPATAESYYWYYCASLDGYYPTVRTCPEPWVKVPPRPE